MERKEITMNIMPYIHNALNLNMTRALCWGILAVCIIYDMLACAFKWTTISEMIRLMDFETGGLVRWFWLALWLHFFIADQWPNPNRIN
jgi:hypothetical protein